MYTPRLAIVTLACCLIPSLSLAQGSEQDQATGEPRRERRDRETAAEGANLGLHINLGPRLLIPMDGGPMGGGLSLGARYGLGAGPVILGPGGRLGGYYISERFVGSAMPTLRLTLPIGPLAPFLVGGVGGGWMSNPSEGGLAVLGGGGLMIHFGRILALGGEVTYEAIGDTEFESLAIGVAIQFF